MVMRRPYAAIVMHEYAKHANFLRHSLLRCSQVGIMRLPMRPLAAAPGSVVVRPFQASEDLGALTGLLHRAYAPQVAAGLEPLAGRQARETTAARIAQSLCLVAEASGSSRPVGVILLGEHEDAVGPPLFAEPGVEHFSMFAIDPAAQGLGVGAQLLLEAERCAVGNGSHTLACTMAGPDVALRDWYLRRGYATAGVWRWPYTNYESVILAKRLEA